MIEVPLYARDGSVRAVALVDDEDAGATLAHRWHLSNRGYVKRVIYPHGRSAGVPVFLHRELMGLERSDPREVDHRNGDQLDCRRSNLRVCTHAENMQNRRGGYGASAHRGVTWHAQMRKWRASAALGGVKYSLGLHDDEQAAADAAAAWRAEHMPFSLEAA